MSKLPQPMRERGASTLRWQRWRDDQRKAVWARCRGVCEASGCTMAAREWAHCFGRRHIIAEPLASHKTMTCGLCVVHHHEMDRDPASDVAAELKWAAIARAVTHFDVEPAPGSDPKGVATAIEDTLRASGEWDRLLEAAGR